MSDIFNIFEEDAGASSAESLSGDGLKSVSALAQRIREAEKAIEKAEAFLKTRKGRNAATDRRAPARGHGRAGHEVLYAGRRR
jgi:hypothetical protein